MRLEGNMVVALAQVGDVAARQVDQVAAPAAATIETTTGPVGDARRGVRALREFDRLRELVDMPSDQLAKHHVEELARFPDAPWDFKPDRLQMPMPESLGFSSAAHYWDSLPRVRDDVRSDLAVLRTWIEHVEESGHRMDIEHAALARDPATTPDTILAEVTDLSPRAWSGDEEALRRLAVLQAYDQPGLDAYVPNKQTLETTWLLGPGGSYRYAKEEVARYWSWAQAQRIERAGVDVDALLAEASRIVDLPEQERTVRDMVLLHAIDRVDQRSGRIGVPDATHHQLQSLVELRGAKPDGGLYVDNVLEGFRLLREQADLVAGAKADPDLARRHVTRIALTPLADVTSKEVRYVAAVVPTLGLTHIDGHLAFEHLATYQLEPWTWAAATERMLELRSVDELLEIASARTADGGPVSGALVEQLALLEPGDLARVGLSDADVHALAMRSLLGEAMAQDASPANIARSMEAIDQKLDEFVPRGSDELAALVGQAHELAERNLARMRSQRFDTYGTHPDYAEVGRFVSIAQLVHASSSVSDAPPAALGAINW